MVQALKNDDFMKKVGENQAELHYNTMLNGQKSVIQPVENGEHDVKNEIETNCNTDKLKEHVKLLKLESPAWIYREGTDFSGRKSFIAVCRVALDGGSPFVSVNLCETEGVSISGKSEAKLLAAEKMMVLLEEKMGSTLEVQRKKSEEENNGVNCVATVTN